MNILKIPAFVLVLAVFCGCATVRLPDYVATRMDGSGEVIDSVDLSFRANSVVTFDALAVCVAESVHNDQVMLREGSVIFAPFGRNYAAGGGDAIKFSDPVRGTMIASGLEDAGLAWGVTRKFVAYDLRADAQSDRVGLRFGHIRQALQSTGAAVNDGFGPAYTHGGAEPAKVVDALDRVSNRIKVCLESG